MDRPDPERLGGLAWTRRTRGALTRAERRRLIAALARAQAENLAGRIKLALGRLPAGAEDSGRSATFARPTARWRAPPKKPAREHSEP